MNIPIVLIIYHRPDLIKNLVNALRSVKPKNIYVVADGPKTPQDKVVCDYARDMIKEIDWPCQIHKIYARVNMGLRKRVVSGLNAVFKKEKWAVILEDDLVVESSFFKYCEILLKKYETDPRVASISGNNFLSEKYKSSSSYYFSKYVHSWGWATWRRAWNFYDDDLSGWKTPKYVNKLNSSLNSKMMVLYWTMIFDRTKQMKVDSWAYRWTYSTLFRNMLTIMPWVNMVSNIGFGTGATHTKEKNNTSNIPISPIKFPLKHPKIIKVNEKIDKRTEWAVYVSVRIVVGLIIRYTYKVISESINLIFKWRQNAESNKSDNLLR